MIDYSLLSRYQSHAMQLCAMRGQNPWDYVPVAMIGYMASRQRWEIFAEEIIHHQQVYEVLKNNP